MTTTIPVTNLLRKRREAASAPAGYMPNADDYRDGWVLISSSGGKDSMGAMIKTAKWVNANGLSLDRVVVVHADLGEVEWPGTKALARRQAESFGFRFEVVSRIGSVSEGMFRGKNTTPLYPKGATRGDMIDGIYARNRQLRARGDTKTAPVYSFSNRSCTADFKVGPIEALMTRLVEEWREAKGLNPRGRKGGVCRMLDVQGLRAEESAKRAKKPEFTVRKKNSRVHIDTWYPIHKHLECHVWDAIGESGLEYHWAYDLGHERGASLKARKALGMKRLSCVFCIFAPRAGLKFAGKHNPKLLARMAKMEEDTGFYFTSDLKTSEPVWLKDIKAELDAGEDAVTDTGDWGDMG